MGSSFRKQVFISWLKIQEQNVLSKPQVKNDNTWYNPKITVGNKSIFFKSFAHLRFIFVGDLLNINVTFISFEKLKQINPATNFLEYAYLRNSVRTTLYSQYFYIPNLKYKNINLLSLLIYIFQKMNNSMI